MNRNRKVLAGVLGAALAVTVAACGTKHAQPSASTLHSALANPVTSQSLSQAQVKGIAHLESCLPNGKSFVGSVMNGTVSWQNGLQLASALGYKVEMKSPFIQSDPANLHATEHKCLPGSKKHPFVHAKKVFEACLKNTKTGVQTTVVKAEAPYKAKIGYHFVSDRHQMEQAAFQATVRVVAACVGSVQ